MARRPSSPLDRAAEVSLALTLVLAPQLLGGARGEAVFATAALATLTLGLFTAARRRAAPPTLVALALGSVMLTGFQLVPLPAFLLEVIHPEVVRDEAFVAAVFERDPRTWLPLSRDPAGTRRMLVQLAAAAAVFLSASALARRKGRRRAVISMVAASVVGLALVGVGHELVGAEAVFGVFEPRSGGPVVLAPLMNPNHFSGFMALGVPLFLGRALDTRDERFRWAHTAVALGLATLCVVSTSRGGLLGLGLGLAVLVSGLLRKRALARTLRPLAVLPLGALAAIPFLGPLLRDAESNGFDKLAVARDALLHALQYPLGVGRGAFSVSFVGVRGELSRFDHAENWLAQLGLEWGLPITLAVVVVLGVALVRALRHARNATHLGAIAALCGLGAHELVDFSSELTGVGTVAAALAAAALTPRSPRRRPGAVRTHGRAMLLGAALCALATLSFGPGVERETRRAETVALRALMEGDDDAAFHELLAAALVAHPAEPEFFLLAAHDALARRDPHALRWINHAMVLAPGWAPPHLLAARALWGQGHSHQAFLELREADRHRAGLGSRYLCAFLARRPRDYPLFEQVYRDEDVHPLHVERLRRCLDELPTDATAQVSAADRARALLPGDPAGALALLEGVSAPRARRVRARALLLAEQPAAALTELGDLADDDAVLALRARAAAALGQWDTVRETYRIRRGRAGADPARVAALYVELGGLEAAGGNASGARAAFRHAHRTSPGAGLGELERLARDRGDDATLEWTLRTRCNIGQAEACARVEELTRQPPTSPSLPLPD